MENPSQITCASISELIQPFVRRHWRTLFIAIVGLAGWLFVNNKPGGFALIMIGLGAVAPIYAWANQTRPGFPICVLMAVQALVIYGSPLVTQNETVFQFPEDQITHAGFEIMIFGLSLALGWNFVTKQIRPQSPRMMREFTLFEGRSINRFSTVGLLMMSAGIAFLLGDMLDVYGFLPSGLYPVIRTVCDGLTMAGGLISAFLIGRRGLNGGKIMWFWAQYISFTVLIIGNYTLFPASAMLMSVSLGLFMGSGRIPWIFLTIVVSILAFLNLSKFEMRFKYWDEGGAYAQVRVEDVIPRMTEWFGRSFAHVTGDSRFVEDWDEEETQSLADRVDSLVILLRAQQYINEDGYSLLGGETYWIIPPLFIPRMFWPDKPRTHEGMVILNVHFGQQTREESLNTYISWGLLPEAYGNFGSILGPLFIGFLLGYGFGWIEHWSRPFPLSSVQALVVLVFIINCASSFESVASVWLTSVFQMVVALAGGMWFFSRPKRIAPVA